MWFFPSKTPAADEPRAATEDAKATTTAPVATADTMDESPSTPVSSPRSLSSSSPLTELSSTPSPVSSPMFTAEYASRRYPSPMSTTVSGTQSPIKLGEPISESALRRFDDGAPPAKRRKIVQPKERTTEYLDLDKPHEELTEDEAYQMDRLLDALSKKKKIVVVAGAGISVSAGIPDFRSSTGLFATARNQHKLKASGKHLFDASVYKHDASTQSFHTMVREMASLTKKAKPTAFHNLLASLAQEGRLLRLYSQNIDCLDTEMAPLATNVPLNLKGPWPTTIQLHGGLQKMVCTKCGELKPFQPELFDGPEAPTCETCEADDQVRTNHAGKRSHGIGRLRPRFVLYNEYNPDEEAIGNVSSADLKARPDAVIVVGTTLKVPGTRRLVKELCQVARGRKNGFTAWINSTPASEPKGAEFKDCWDLVVRSTCDEVAKLAALPAWDFQIGEDYMVSKEQEMASQESRTKTSLQVHLPSRPSSSPPAKVAHLTGAKPKAVEDIQGIPTPRPSPKISAVKHLGKTKQAKISFSNKAEDKPTKTSKAKARKPKQPVKTQPPKNSLMQSFKPVKNVPGRDTVKEIGSDGPISAVPAVKQEPDASVSLPALRPQRQNSVDTFRYTRDTEASDDKASDEKPSDSSSDPPSTPTMTEPRPSRETISPPSVPRSMQNLIDV